MRALKVSQALIRSFSSTARNRLENRVAEKQKLFQAENDLPVHLKGGGTDGILYRLTMALCLGGARLKAQGLVWIKDQGFPTRDAVLGGNLTQKLKAGIQTGTVYSLYCLGWASFPHKK